MSQKSKGIKTLFGLNNLPKKLIYRFHSLLSGSRNKQFAENKNFLHFTYALYVENSHQLILLKCFIFVHFFNFLSMFSSWENMYKRIKQVHILWNGGNVNPTNYIKIFYHFLNVVNVSWQEICFNITRTLLISAVFIE